MAALNDLYWLLEGFKNYRPVAGIPVPFQRLVVDRKQQKPREICAQGIEDFQGLFVYRMAYANQENARRHPIIERLRSVWRTFGSNLEGSNQSRLPYQAYDGVNRYPERET